MIFINSCSKPHESVLDWTFPDGGRLPCPRALGDEVEPFCTTGATTRSSRGAIRHQGAATALARRLSREEQPIDVIPRIRAATNSPVAAEAGLLLVGYALTGVPALALEALELTLASSSQGSDLGPLTKLFGLEWSPRAASDEGGARDHGSLGCTEHLLLHISSPALKNDLREDLANRTPNAACTWANGLHQMAEGNLPAAEKLLRSASEETVDLANAVALDSALLEIYRSDYEAASTLLEAPRRSNWPSIKPRAERLLGLALLRKGELASAYRQYFEAHDEYLRLEAIGDAEALEAHLAEVLRLSGRLEESWVHRLRALRNSAIGGSAGLRYGVLWESGMAALREERPNSALLFFTQAHQVARTTRHGERSPVSLADPLIRIAEAHLLLGNLRGAEEELRRALRVSAAIPRPIAERMRAQIDVAQANVLLAQGKPDAALHRARTASSFFEHTDNLLEWPLALEIESRALATLGDEENAVAALRQAINVLGSRQRDGSTPVYDTAFAVQSARLYRKLARYSHQRSPEQEAKTLLLLQQSRGLFYGAEWDLPEDPQELQIHAYQEGGGLVLWLLRSSGLQLVEQPLPDLAGYPQRTALGQVGNALLRAVQDLQDLSHANTVTVITSKLTEALPLSQIFRAAGFTGTISMQLRSGPTTGRPLGGAPVLVGHGALSHPDAPIPLPPLSQVKDEVDDLRQLHPDGGRFTGASSEFLADVRSAELIHFAGHVVQLPRHDQPAMIFDDGIVPLDRLNPKPGSLFVLSACSASRSIWNDELGINRAVVQLLRDGAGGVIASPRPVADAQARHFSRAFHRSLKLGKPAHVALADALTEVPETDFRLYLR